MLTNLKITVMKRYKEITIDNLEELKDIISGVKAEAEEKKEYSYKTVLLIGEETIKKAADKYNIILISHLWPFADSEVEHLKINGTAEFVYVAFLEIYWDAVYRNRGETNIKRIEKVISYKGHLLSVYTNYKCKTYSFSLLNEEENDNRQGVTVEKPNKVGTLTDKKADEWLAALLDEAEKRNRAKNEAAERKAAYIRQMSKLTGRPESTFEKNGTLHLGMFVVGWEYYPDGRVYTRVEINPLTTNKSGDFMSNLEKLAIFAKCGLLG